MNFEYIKNCNEIELKVYVDKLLENLFSSTLQENVIGFEHVTPHKGIIHEQTRISNSDSDFVIKNREYMYEFVKLLKARNVKTIASALNLIYPYIINYFGLDSNSEKRIEYYVKSNEKIPDVSLLKNKNAAVCAERAAIVQNLFSLLGIESYYCIGNISTKQGSEPHAFNVINYLDSYYVYDASSDVPIIKDGKTVSYGHYLCNIKEEEFDKLLRTNTPIAIADSYLVISENKMYRVENGKRVYESYGSIKENESRKKI